MNTPAQAGLGRGTHPGGKLARGGFYMLPNSYENEDLTSCAPVSGGTLAVPNGYGTIQCY
jgi:hypothetical protein